MADNETDLAPGFRSLMTLLSAVYGGVIAMLAVLGYDHVGMAAALGAILIGTGWAAYGAIRRKS